MKLAVWKMEREGEMEDGKREAEDKCGYELQSRAHVWVSSCLSAWVYGGWSRVRWWWHGLSCGRALHCRLRV
jgi:hypothetical protein